MMRRISQLVIIFILLTITAITAAQEDTDSTAHIRIAHFSPDAPAVDIFINGTLTEVNGISFPEVTEWIALASGTIEIAAVPAGRPIEDTAIGPLVATLSPDGWYTIALIGTLARGSLSAIVLEEDFSPPADGNMRMSMFHAIADVPPINIIANDITLVQTLGYPGFFGDNDGFTSADIPAGSYEIVITPFDAPNTTLVNVGTYTLGAGNNYLIAAVGSPSNPLFVLVSSDMQALLAGETPATETIEPNIDVGNGSAIMRVVHLSSGTPAFDVYLDGELSAAQNLAFGTFSNWVELPAGIYSVIIAPVGTSPQDALIGPVNVALVTDGVYTLAAVGILGNATLSLEVLEENFAPLDTGQARLSIFHAAPSTGGISLHANGNELVFGLAFAGRMAEISDSFVTRDILAGDYDLQLILTDDPDTVLIDLPDTRLEVGHNYFIAALDAAPPYVLTATALSTINGD